VAVEPVLEVGADLIGSLGDAGADDGDHAARVGTKCLHGGDGGVDDAVQRALPAGMGRAHDARPGISQQHGGAVGGQDGADDARGGGDHGVALGPVALPAGLGNPGDGGVDLETGGEVIGDAAEMSGDAAAVLGDGGRVVLRADAGVQPFIQAGGNAALPGEEAVADSGAVKEGMGDGGERHGQSSKPGTTSERGEKIAQALNRVPI